MNQHRIGGLVVYVGPERPTRPEKEAVCVVDASLVVDGVEYYAVRDENMTRYRVPAIWLAPLA